VSYQLTILDAQFLALNAEASVPVAARLLDPATATRVGNLRSTTSLSAHERIPLLPPLGRLRHGRLPARGLDYTLLGLGPALRTLADFRHPGDLLYFPPCRLPALSYLRSLSGVIPSLIPPGFFLPRPLVDHPCGDLKPHPRPVPSGTWLGGRRSTTAHDGLRGGDHGALGWLILSTSRRWSREVPGGDPPPFQWGRARAPRAKDARTRLAGLRATNPADQPAALLLGDLAAGVRAATLTTTP